jgi:AraC family carnitine catabolism transcriptional activator
MGSSVTVRTQPKGKRRAILAENSELVVGSLKDLAGRMELSVSRVAHLFKQEFNTSPARYLRLIRVLRSKELLATTKASIKEIGVQCGFSSSCTFSRTFRRVVGVSPLAYRKALAAQLSGPENDGRAHE